MLTAAQHIEHRPGSTRANRRRVELEDAVQVLRQSITTATLQHCPARLVPPPRERMGAPNCRQAASVASASSLYRNTTPIGTWR